MPVCLRARVLSYILVVLASLATGCTVMYTVPNEPVKLAAMEPIHMTVALRLTEELCNAKWEKHAMGDRYILPIGNALCINAEAVTRAVFTEVKIIRDKAASPITDVDAVLIPSLAALERDRPATVVSIQTTSILFNWSLNDERGEPIWVTAIIGEGKGPMGHPSLKDSGREQVEKVLSDVFQKSLHEMSSSHSIREFATNRLISKEK